MAHFLFGLRPIQILLIVLVVANVAMLSLHWLGTSGDEGPVPSPEAGAAEEPPGSGAAEAVADVLLLSERPSEAPEAPAGGGQEADAEPALRTHAQGTNLVEGDAPPPGAELPEPARAVAAADAGPDAAAGAQAFGDGATGSGTVAAGTVESEPADPERRPEAPAGDQAACRAWGPFNDAAAAEAVASELALDEAAYRVVDEAIGAAPDYLVYIDHGGNRESARRLLQELRTQDVEGYIMRGRFNDAVSVGVFSQEERATRQQERVSAMGYAARMEVLERTQRVYYLAARVPLSAVDRGGPNKPCSDIAPARDIL
jgi:hypothetical protein